MSRRQIRRFIDRMGREGEPVFIAFLVLIAVAWQAFGP